MTHDTLQISSTKNIFERYRRIQNVCDNLLERMENYFDQNLILDDPKELLRLEALLKIRTKLLEFEREIRLEVDTLSQKTIDDNNNNRETLINEIINKINQAKGQ